MWAFLWAVFGAIFGSVLADDAGFFFGGALGALIGLGFSLRGRITKLESDVSALTVQLRLLQTNIEHRALVAERRVEAPLVATPTVTASTTDTHVAETPVAATPVVDAPPDDAPVVDAPVTQPPVTEVTSPDAPAPTPKIAEPSPQPLQWEPARPDPIVQAFKFARAWLFGGNTVVRVGTLVLLVGVVLLLKYAADHAVLPIEVRLSAVALLAIALTAVGYRQRHARPGFGLTAQGGGVATAYLVVFFAYRTYELVPPTFAFAGFVAIAAASATLAVAQRSQTLAFIGSLGGFAAPVLASSGSGNHVALFSYYLLLNVMVVGIAWFRAWRGLNLLAFVCTYGVATAWGALKYRPENFNSTEPFVIAFFLLFVMVSVLFAMRSKPRLGGVVDGSLVFGTPLVTLLAQTHLVQDKEFGMALSAAGFGLFYVVLGTVLWQRSRNTFRNLVESFVAIGVGFGTLAIPFALDNALTTAMAWALEGAGMYWIGTRQQRTLPKLSGLALQVLAAGSLLRRSDVLFDIELHKTTLPLINVTFITCITLAIAAFVIAITASKERTRTRREGLGFTQVMGLWGYGFLLFACITEIEAHVVSTHETGAVLLVVAITSWLLIALARATAWRAGELLALLLIPDAALVLFVELVDDSSFQGIALIGWPVVVVSTFLLVQRARVQTPWTRWLFAPSWWLAISVVASGATELVGRFDDLGDAWSFAACGGGALATFVLLVTLTARRIGPFAFASSPHLIGGAGPIIAATLLYCLSASLSQSGDTFPLPYVPLLNPIDVAHALSLLSILAWYRHTSRDADTATPAFQDISRSLIVVSAALCFLWLNAIVARSVHHYANVTFHFEPLWRSVELQSSLSITWTVVALLTMLWATRKHMRVVWIVAAALLGLVVLKLFTIDLARLSTLLKIGTFLVVGVLLMAIGYLSPVPPSASEKENT